MEVNTIFKQTDNDVAELITAKNSQRYKSLMNQRFNPQRRWAKLLSEINAWAKLHNFKVYIYNHKHEIVLQGIMPYESFSYKLIVGAARSAPEKNKSLYTIAFQVMVCSDNKEQCFYNKQMHISALHLRFEFTKIRKNLVFCLDKSLEEVSNKFDVAVDEDIKLSRIKLNNYEGYEQVFRNTENLVESNVNLGQ